MTLLSNRGAARGLAAAVVTGTFLATTALAASAADKSLYGVQDPTFDGVYRQAVSLLALHATGTAAPDLATRWLVDQQCDNGAWTAYRADTSAACAAGTEDSNATAVAAQALTALGVSPEHDVASWLRSIQNDDGGFPYGPAGNSDANSTALTLGAFAALGVEPTSVTSAAGRSGTDALADLQLGCGADPASAGAFDYAAVDFAGDPKPTLGANDFATVQAVPGLLGLSILTPPAPAPVASVPVCPARAGSDAERAAWGADYLQRTLNANPDGPFLPSVFGTGADFGSTANAALALAATGVSLQTATAAVAWLASNAVESWVPDPEGADRPAALATLILAAEATGRDATDFGGENLVQRLLATGPQPANPASAASDPGTSAEDPTPAPTAAATDPGQTSSAGAAAAAAPTLPDTGADSGVLLTATFGGLALTGLGVGLQRWGSARAQG